MKDMSILFIIPARGGSKGIPRKNIKLLAGVPLIGYAIDIAKKLSSEENICITTDDLEIANVARDLGVPPLFIRPPELATDYSGIYDVIMHAINFYENIGRKYKMVVVLQPTSPLRTLEQVKSAISCYHDDLDLVVSVKETASNPYYVLFEENNEGFLYKSKKGNFVRRQDCPRVYEYNGAVYVYNVVSLKEKKINDFTRIKKFVMDEINSVDIDTPLDWEFTEFLLSSKMILL